MKLYDAIVDLIVFAEAATKEESRYSISYRTRIQEAAAVLRRFLVLVWPEDKPN